MKDAMAPNFSDDDFRVKRMAVTIDPKKCSVRASSTATDANPARARPTQVSRGPARQ